ncbi:hemolin-like [Pararge aegeria]|uniref:hemolin-like n=1 Tax=Pararge aegeria TaxID=116150 RepID=UPI0019D185C8|nr:hemolin-like [Pararge aegeria]
MSPITSCAFFALCALLCASQPVEKLPVLRQLPSEVVFADHKELLLECATEGKEEGVKYKWTKDGKPLTSNTKVDQRGDEGTLIFKNPSKDDEGAYQCYAESPLGVATSRLVHVRRAHIDVPSVNVQKHKPVEGKTYKLECKIPNSYPKPEISWILQTEKSKGDVKGERFTISDEGDLYISSVAKEDTGNMQYICVGKSPAVDSEVVLAKHVLEDVVPSKEANHEMVQQYVTKDTTLKAGESVYLYCIYGGIPLGHPDWFKDGVDINNNSKDRVTRYNKSVGKRLIIKEVLLEDEGSYSCVIDNEVGKVQKHTFQVKVVSAPQFVKQPVQKLIVKQGQDVTIPCQVRAVPEAKLAWSFNSDKLPERLQAHTSSQGNVAVSDLVIKGVQKSDSGYYGCRAQNEYGDVYAETLVYVQ